MSVLIVAFCFFANNGLEVNKTLRVPEAHAMAGVPQPIAIAAGPDGRVYLLDGTSKTLLVWDRDGAMTGRVGGPGQGEGRFLLQRTRQGKPFGFVDARKDGLFVYDGGQARMHVFDPDTYQLLDSYTFKVRPGQPIHLDVVSANRLLVNWVSLDAGRNFTAALFNPNTYDAEPVAGRPDLGINHSKDENGILLLTYRAFSPELTARYDARNNQILWGDGAEPVLHRLPVNEDGSWGDDQALNMALTQETVVDKDKRVIMRLPFLLQGGNSSVDFPRERPYFNDVLTYGESDYLMVYRFTAADRIYGTRVAADGKVLGLFDREVEEGELFEASRGRVFHVETLGGIHVHELRFP